MTNLFVVNRDSATGLLFASRLILMLGLFLHAVVEGFGAISADGVLNWTTLVSVTSAIVGFCFYEFNVSKSTGLSGQIKEALIEADTDEWRREGNLPVTEETIHTVKSFLEELPVEYQHPDIAPEPDGHVSMEWYVNKRRLLTVSAAPGNRLYWAALIDNEDPRGSLTLQGSVPNTVLFMLERIHRNA